MSRKQIDAPLQPNEAFGHVVRAVRQEAGWSQEDLGVRAGLEQAYISGIERGTRNPTIQTIWVIAEGLQVRPDELIRRATVRIQKSRRADS